MIDELKNIEIIGNLGVGYDEVEERNEGEKNVMVKNKKDVMKEEVEDKKIGIMIDKVREL